MSGARQPTTGAQMSEIVRLAVPIADDAALEYVTSYCRAERIGNHTYYDTNSVDADSAELVATAVEYLHLRCRIERHPARGTLLRFIR